MAKGKVISIFIAPAAKAPMKGVAEVRAVAGKGLQGDRYFRSEGTFSSTAGPGGEATLVEAEAVAAAAELMKTGLEPSGTRRNIVTRGISLNHLVGKEFRVGEVVLRGLRLCEPCAHLESLTREGVKSALLHRAGLRSQILQGGMIRVGDEVAPLDSTESENKKLIRRYYDEMWNPWNFDAAAEILSPEIVFYGSLGVATRGIEAFRAYMRTVRAAFPNFHNTIEEILAEDDKIVARLCYTGTHRGPVFEIAPTGKTIAYSGAAFFRIADGKVAQGWVLGDRMGLVEQLRGSSIEPETQDRGKK
jgi:predicted ester cyclase